MHVNICNICVKRPNSIQSGKEYGASPHDSDRKKVSDDFESKFKYILMVWNGTKIRVYLSNRKTKLERVISFIPNLDYIFYEVKRNSNQKTFAYISKNPLNDNPFDGYLPRYWVGWTEVKYEGSPDDDDVIQYKVLEYEKDTVTVVEAS